MIACPGLEKKPSYASATMGTSKLTLQFLQAASPIAAGTGSTANTTSLLIIVFFHQNYCCYVVSGTVKQQHLLKIVYLFLEFASSYMV